ncbi:hypothetical protein [Microbacterium sp. Marseille-Q6965]|uniref:hypothetical protein n=1 Tax=Microbacterium sp. Marseille-Q6965 TaxID=2965072 RepID=UPI0021B791DF|nr:hypothetical protein [Microbacterium sp. Marseille-Q6965]
MTNLYQSVVNGWTIRVTAGVAAHASHLDLSVDDALCRFDASLVKIPSQRRMAVHMFPDASIARVPALIRLLRSLAVRNGNWPGTPWARRQRPDGTYALKTTIGTPVNVAEEFAQIVEHVDLATTRERALVVTAETEVYS